MKGKGFSEALAETVAHEAVDDWIEAAAEVGQEVSHEPRVVSSRVVDVEPVPNNVDDVDRQPTESKRCYDHKQDHGDLLVTRPKTEDRRIDRLISSKTAHTYVLLALKKA